MLSIRSQNRMSLVPYEDTIEINHGMDKDEWYITTKLSQFKVLGTYKTAKRALEVLDEIEERIENESIKIIVEENDYKKIMTRGSVVYQMPKE